MLASCYIRLGRTNGDTEGTAKHIAMMGIEKDLRGHMANCCSDWSKVFVGRDWITD